MADQEVRTRQNKTAESAGAARPAMPSDDAPMLEPSEAELDEWAAQERRRREAWLKGPTDAEKRAYAQLLRERRLAELEGTEAWLAERARMMGRYSRETQLAVEGALSLFLKWSKKSMTELVEAGREWEEEFGRPSRRRRVKIDDEGS